MDITGLSVDSIPTLAMGMKQIGVLSDVNTGLMKMSLDNYNAQAATLTKMMEQSVNPNLGGNIDISV